jgi:glycerol kinase
MNSKNGLFLAIDQSTSATKALLFTADGRLVDQSSISHRQYYPRSGWVEHDAEEIYDNTRKAIASLAASPRSMEQPAGDQYNEPA